MEDIKKLSRQQGLAIAKSVEEYVERYCDVCHNSNKECSCSVYQCSSCSHEIKLKRDKELMKDYAFHKVVKLKTNYPFGRRSKGVSIVIHKTCPSFPRGIINLIREPKSKRLY